MPPKPPPPAAIGPKPEPYFFHGHRKPTQNHPTVHGGYFSNRKSIRPHNPTIFSDEPFDLQKWNPDEPNSSKLPSDKDPSEKFFALAKNLSPVTRYILDAFRKHKHWGQPLLEDLDRLRVPSILVEEVLKFPYADPRLASKFFHWAGKQKGYRHDFACYNAYAHFLNRINRFRDADEVPELMNIQGKPPTEKQFEILIGMHCDAKRGLRVYYVYEKMKKFGVKPSISLYNRVMDALVKTNHLDLAMAVYDDFKNDGLVEEGVTFMVLAKGLCKAGRMVEMFDLLEKMRGNLCRPDVFAYTAMVKVLVSVGNLDGSLKVWEEMRKDSVEPDTMAYSTLILALCEANMVEKGYVLFKEMKERKCLIDRAIYGSLINSYVADGKLGSACGLLKDLMDAGYRADLAIYNSLIEGFCNAKLVHKAYKLFQVTVREDLQPDFHTVKPMLLSYAESKRMEDFSKLLEQMQKLNFSVTDYLIKFFSFTVEKNGGVIIALEVFEYLKVKNNLHLAIYNILMKALLNSNEEKKALELFHDLKDTGLAPDSSIYNTSILCYVKIGEIQEARECYNKIHEMSEIPSVAAYHSLVKGLSVVGEVEDAMMLIRDCLANVENGPLEFKYTLTIIHLCRLKDADKVVEVLNEMVEQGCPPNSITYAAIIYGMCKHGAIEEARAVFSHMKNRKHLSEADVLVYDEILIDHMHKKAADLVSAGLKFFGLEKKVWARTLAFKEEAESCLTNQSDKD